MTRLDHPEEWSEEERAAVAAAFAPLINAYVPWSESIARSLTSAVTLSIGPALQKLSDSIAQIYTPQFRPLFESIAKIAARIFPENWNGIHKPKFGELESILLDEGIPLMWVPGPEILEALMNASDASARRRVIGRRWRGVVADCETALAAVKHPGLVDARYFATRCAAALRDGHSEAAQALAANLLDSVLSTLLDKERRLKLTKNDFKRTGIKLDLDDFGIRAAFTFAPVWHAHAQFWVEKGDQIPRKFGRHPSVHAVSRAQYTRINAAIALMLVTSVLCFLNSELPSSDSR